MKLIQAYSKISYLNDRIEHFKDLTQKRFEHSLPISGVEGYEEELINIIQERKNLQLAINKTNNDVFVEISFVDPDEQSGAKQTVSLQELLYLVEDNTFMFDYYTSLKNELLKIYSFLKKNPQYNDDSERDDCIGKIIEIEGKRESVIKRKFYLEEVYRLSQYKTDLVEE